MILIIAEKAIAGRRIAAILAGKNLPDSRTANALHFDFEKGKSQFTVVPLSGHIVDVDFAASMQQWLGTDLRKLVDAPVYYLETEPYISGLLKKIAPNIDEVIIATDADREGEAIGLEALNLVKQANPKVIVKRANFSAITDKDINDAFAKLGKLDFDLAESANSRREIDLVWGAVLTRLLSLVSGKLGKDFLSVGRVQSPTLALIVDREKQRLAFIVQKYWEIEALFEKGGKKFLASHKQGRFLEKEKALAVLKCKEPPIGIIVSVKKKQKTLARPPPFNTTSFLRAATSLGYSAGRAMQVAESLYQSGYISYPRTDNEAYPTTLDLRATLVELAKVPDFKPFADQLLKQEKLVASAGKPAKDHPPIHPVTAAEKSKLDSQTWKIYELVCMRFMATLAKDALTENILVEIDLNRQPFIATGQTYIEMGWKVFYPYSKAVEVILPELAKNDKVNLLRLDSLEKETLPPPRYSQGALIKAMSDLNLGTKCLTADTGIKVFNSPVCSEKDAKSLFDNSIPWSESKGAEFRLNKKFECLSLDAGNEIQKSLFLGVSRRKLGSKESIIEVVFEDGSKFQATSCHLICCFEDDKLGYKPLNSLRGGDTVVALHDNSTKGIFGEIALSSLLNSCTKETNLFACGISENLKQTRKMLGLTAEEFAEKLSCSRGNYSSYELGNRPVPLWIAKSLETYGLNVSAISSQNKKAKLQAVFPLKWSAQLVRILGCLIGDGSIDKAKLGKENSVDFRYTNTDPFLVKSFDEAIKSISGVKCKVLVRKTKHKDVYQLKIPSVVGRIVAVLFPETIKKGVCSAIPKELWPDFVGAIFDDEGHVYKSETKLFISNTNHKMLQKIKAMLLENGIRSRLDLKQHKLMVSDKKSLLFFLEKIPIKSFKKKYRLVKMLSGKYFYNQCKFPQFILYKKIFAMLQQKPLQTLEIANQFGLSKGVVVRGINTLRRYGFLKKTVVGNNKGYRRIIKYQAAKPLVGTAFEVIGETMLNPHLATKTVLETKKVHYTGPVYDISNSKALPNFVLSNNVIVHNSTRAETIQKLYNRRYIEGQKAIVPTKIAFAVIDSLEKHESAVVKPEMTANLEKEMDLVAAGEKSKESVVNESRGFLGEVLGQLLLHKDEIGSTIRNAARADSIIGPCPRQGCTGELLIRKGRTGKRFLGCSAYPKCTTTFPLPQKGNIAVLPERCGQCGSIMLHITGKRYRFKMCISTDCKSKDEWKKRAAEKAERLAKAQQGKSPESKPAESKASPVPEKKPVQEKQNAAEKPAKLKEKKPLLEKQKVVAKKLAKSKGKKPGKKPAKAKKSSG